MSLAPEEKLAYREGGDKALAQFEAGVQGFLAASFRGCGVVTSDPFEVSDGAPPAMSTPFVLPRAPSLCRRSCDACACLVQSPRRSRCSSVTRRSASTT
jgi:hypothetical protein